MNGWEKVKDLKDLREKYNFPFLPRSKFEQLYEVCSIHAAKKGLNGICYTRREEVDEAISDVEDFEEYSELLRKPLEDLDVYARRVTVRPAGYLRLEASNILPEWPGKHIFILYFLVFSNFYDF